MFKDNLEALRVMLERMIHDNLSIIARAVTREKGSPFKHASNITRYPKLMAILDEYQVRQHELRSLHQNVNHLSKLTRADGDTRRVRVEGRIASNEAQSTKHLTLAHLGLSRNIVTDIEPELKGGRPVRVLPEWKLPAVGIYAITPRKDAQPAKVQQATKVVREYLSSNWNRTVPA